MMYHCSGSCFLWTFPFTLMSAPKWQNKWGHLQYVHTSNVRWMKTQDLSRLLFVVVEAIPEEVIWPEPQRMDLCYRCLIKIASKSVILWAFFSSSSHRFLLYNTTFLHQKAPFMVLWVYWNSAERSSLPVRGLASQRSKPFIIYFQKRNMIWLPLSLL